MKIDLHVHSNWSRHPNEWILRKLGAQESYSDPLDVYRIAKARGMDAVTITDHNSIDACLSIAHLPDTFMSSEYTTYFPSDGCKVHVVCYRITPEQHEQIQQERSDIYRLVAFLKREKILHTLAHAFFGPNGKMSPEHFHQLLGLFDTWEINGAKDSWANRSLRAILDVAKPDHKLTAGSDDHSSLTIAHAWTEVRDAQNLSEFFEGVRCGKTVIGGSSSTPHTLALNIYSVGWQWLKHTNAVNGFSSTVDRYLLPAELLEARSIAKRIWMNTKAMNPRYWGRDIALALVNRELEGINRAPVDDVPLSHQWFRILEGITNRYIGKMGNRLIEQFCQRDFYDMFSNLGSPVALYALIAPYFVAFANFASQRKLARETLRQYSPTERQPVKVAKFTDTFGTIDGVSRTLDEQLAEALRTGKDYTIISCVGENNRSGLKLFEPVGMIPAPEFEQQQLCWPPLLKMMDYCYEEQFTHLQASTPGPVGLAGLLVARTLKIPFQAVYHTQIPDFVGKVTDDPLLEELARKYCLWFYDCAETIFAPSEHTRNQLVRHGIKAEKIRVYPRGVDTDFFHPSRRTRYWESAWGVQPGTVKALYVGRVSREKNLPLLVKAFKKLIDRMRPSSRTSGRPAVVLLVVGKGGYWDEMKEECLGYPVLFAGELEGDKLAEAYASADFFVLPSTTDTHGRVVLEAMASGLPCIVSDVGGPRENVATGVTGFVVPADDERALADALWAVAVRVDRQTMGRRAREFSEGKSFSSAFEQMWKLFAA